MSEYQWKTVSVIGFDELMGALKHAERKGYMPDVIREEWEAFNWKLEPPDQKPVYTSPPQREWVGLTDEEYTELWGMKPDLLNFFRKIEAKLKEKNT